MASANNNSVAELLKLEQTLFALPFAYMGMLLAGQGFPGLKVFLLITLAMAAARTAGMSLNRVIDMEIDARNPRTKNRALPAGLIKPSTAVLIALVSLVLLFYSAWSLNKLCFYLSPLAVLLLWAYSYLKRFTSLCHLVLGMIEFCAPVGAWIAVTGTLELPSIYLGVAILLWITGVDIIYSVQDYAFDVANGIFSVPARIGVKNALRAARVIHLLSVSFLILTMIKLGLGFFFLAGILGYASLLSYQHYIVRTGEAASIGKVFFKLNSWSSVTLLVFTVLEVL